MLVELAIVLAVFIVFIGLSCLFMTPTTWRSDLTVSHLALGLSWAVWHICAGFVAVLFVRGAYEHPETGNLLFATLGVPVLAFAVVCAIQTATWIATGFLKWRKGEFQGDSIRLSEVYSSWGGRSFLVASTVGGIFYGLPNTH